MVAIIIIIIIFLIVILILGINQKNNEVSATNKFVEDGKKNEIEKVIKGIKQGLVNYQIVKEYINKNSKYDGDKVINTLQEYHRINNSNDNSLMQAFMNYKSNKVRDIYDLNDTNLMAELLDLYSNAINYIEYKK